MKMGMCICVAWLKGLPNQCPDMAKSLAMPLTIYSHTLGNPRNLLEAITHKQATINMVAHKHGGYYGCHAGERTLCKHRLYIRNEYILIQTRP